MSLPDNSKPIGGGPLAHLIDQLSAKDAELRKKAAREIFAAGLARAKPSIEGWLADPDVRDCFVFDDSGSEERFPRMTVGIAVEPTRFAKIFAANGSPRLANVPVELDAEEFEIRVSPDVHLDILTTRDRNADGAIARFLRKRGEEIQQIEIAVHSIDRAAALLHDRFGLDPVYWQARAGADGTRVNFFLVRGLESAKVLFELVEESSHVPPDRDLA